LVLGLARDTSDPHRYVLTATTAIIPMLAHPTATMVLDGSRAASLSAPARGTGAITDVGSMDPAFTAADGMAEVITDTLAMATTVVADTDIVAAVLRAQRLVAASVVASLGVGSTAVAFTAVAFTAVAFTAADIDN
jgi:hypothetical protein